MKPLDKAQIIVDLLKGLMFILNEKIDILRQEMEVCSARPERRIELKEQIQRINIEIYYLLADIEQHEEYIKERQKIVNHVNGNLSHLTAEANERMTFIVKSLEEIREVKGLDLDIRKEIFDVLKLYYNGCANENEKLTIFSSLKSIFERSKAMIDSKSKV